ncbi:MAG: hypothetical protein JW807_00780 [Spirochaetes bacterium]|nr:hypothetical protein [Spirochaetota bacterium]
MAEIIDFYSHPVAYIRVMQNAGDKVNELVNFFINKPDEIKFAIFDSLKKHKGECIILICTTKKEPLCYWAIKTEDIGPDIWAMMGNTIMPEHENTFFLFHITDDDILGFATIEISDAVQFSASMPKASWFANINRFHV